MLAQPFPVPLLLLAHPVLGCRAVTSFSPIDVSVHSSSSLHSLSLSPHWSVAACVVLGLRGSARLVSGLRCSLFFSALPPPVGFTFHSSFGRSTTSRGDGGLGWFRAETARVIRSVAHSFVYIQRLDIKPVYTAVDRSQHPYSAQEAARDKQTRIAVERSSLVFSVVQADSRALGQPSSAAGNTHIGWLECRLASSVGSNSTVGVSGRCAVLRHSHGSA